MDNKVQFFGTFNEDFPPGQEYLIIGFSPSSIPLKQRWRNNGLSADFLADYLATFFPINEDEPVSASRQAEIKGAVSYIANELLENAMKYSHENSSHPIKIQLYLNSDKIVFYIANSIHPKTAEKFQAYLKNLINSDPQELYIQQLEKNALDNNPNSVSGLGILTMINDYGAKLGWKFVIPEPDCDEMILTTMAEITV
jgi:hypothetical protein